MRKLVEGEQREITEGSGVRESPASLSLSLSLSLYIYIYIYIYK
jgi:hypothetical protein